MNTPARITYFWALITSLVAAAIVVSIGLCVLKQEGLSYQTRDYAYYLEFAVRTFDSAYPQAVSINPNGYNVFRFGGTEAMTSIHQGIHLEPGKYVTAFLLSFAKNPFILYVWYCVLFFAPLFYFVYHARTRISDKSILLLTCLYLTFPSMLLAPTNDLRPFILMAPAVLFAVTAFVFNASLFVRLLSLLALFFVREEGLVLAAPLLLGASVSAWREGKLKRFVRKVLPLVLIWLVAIAVSAVYFVWAGYENTILRSLGKHRLLLGIAALVASVGGVVAWRVFSGRLKPLFVDVLYAVPLVFVGLQFVLVVRTSGLVNALLHPYFAVGAAAVLPLLAWHLPVLRSRAVSVFGVGLLIVLVAMAVFLPQGVVRTAFDWYGRVHDAALVQAYAEEKREGYVMTDYDTHQAFFTQAHLFNYERVPGTLLAGSDRYFPQNEATVRSLLEETELIVVSTRSIPLIKDLIRDSFVLVEQNNSYVVFGLRTNFESTEPR